MEQETDAALSQLHHTVNVHHGLLVPPAQVGAHLCVQVLQLTHTHTGKSFSTQTGRAGSAATWLSSRTSGVCRLLRRPWTYLSSSSLNVSQIKE